jgi:Phytanoyl-CoA dioxygenase (PhyH)
MSIRLDPGQYQTLHQRFAIDGYLLFKDVVPKPELARLTSAIRGAYRDAVSQGTLFVGGGTLSGHLNCFPGEGSRFVYEALREHGIVDLVQSLSLVPLRAPNIGCNLNLPGSAQQNEHVDGYAASPFLIANVAAVDTDLLNGATELLVGTHNHESKYWQIALQRPLRRRPTVQQGDVIVRISSLWHRGMPNRSTEPRPMLAFTWEDGGSPLADPYRVHEGRITFLPNRFRTDWKGRIVEQAFVAAPRLGTAYHIARSFFS